MSLTYPTSWRRYITNPVTGNVYKDHEGNHLYRIFGMNNASTYIKRVYDDDGFLQDESVTKYQIAEVVNTGNYNDASLLVIGASGHKAGKLHSVKPTDGSGDFTVVRATESTRVNQAGETETVPVNTPVLTYSEGTPVLRVTTDTISITSLQAISAIAGNNDGVIVIDLNGTEYTFVFEAGNGVKIYVDKLYSGELADIAPDYYKLQKGDFKKILMMYSSTNAAAILGLTTVTPDLSLAQGLNWNKDTDVYERTGTLTGITLSTSAGNENLPIHSRMKRCLVNDDETVNYYIDPADPIMQLGDTVYTAEGTNTTVTANKLIDSTATFVTDGIVAGLAIRNTTTGKVCVVSSVDSETQLTLSRDYFLNTGEGYEIGTANYGGADGQVMVEIPKFWYYETHGTVHHWSVSLDYIAGMKLHPAFYRNGAIVEYRYMSAFEGSVQDASDVFIAKAAIPTAITISAATGHKLCSVAGQWPKVREQITEYRAAASNRGTNWTQLDFPLHSAVQLLYLIEYADFDSQGTKGNNDTIGAGRTNLSGGVWEADSYIGQTGLSIADGNGTNSVSLGGTSGYLTDYMSYRGIENLFGNTWKMVELAVDGTWQGDFAAMPFYYTNNKSHYNTQNDTNLKLLGNSSYIGASVGYIADIEDVEFGFIPKSVSGGSATTKLCDQYYQYNESGRDYWRAALVGSDATNGVRAGVFTLLVYAVWSSGAVTFAARLCA